MNFDVAIEGAEGGAESLGIDPKLYERMQINAVNRTGRWVKRVLLVEPLSKATGIKTKILNDRIQLRNATKATPAASIVPSSRGIAARSFRHRAAPVQGSKVRARVMVDWLEGEKVAAGFINPLSTRKLPLATRSVRERKVKKGARNPHIKQYRYNYQTPKNAQGPSAAAMFKVAVTQAMRDQAADKLAEEFNVELDKVLF